MSESFRQVAVDAAKHAGAYLRERERDRRTVSRPTSVRPTTGRPPLPGPAVSRPTIIRKSSAIDLVTEIDRGAEALIVEAIRAHFPDHSILAEEGGSLPGVSTHRWVIDPLDGTTNFVHGLPIYSVSIALEIDGLATVGVVYHPSLDECFVSVRGRGASLNGRAIRVSATPTLDESLVATGFPYDVRETQDTNLPEYEAFTRRSRIVRELGSAAITLAWVAAGRLDGFWELRLGPWDVAAGALLVEEAGGRVTDLGGEPVDTTAPAVVASNGSIHEEMIRTLKEVRAR